MEAHAYQQLLRNTLPVLLEIESIRPNSTGGFPALVIIAVDTFRLVWDHAGKRCVVILIG